MSTAVSTAVYTIVLARSSTHHTHAVHTLFTLDAHSSEHCCHCSTCQRSIELLALAIAVRAIATAVHTIHSKTHTKRFISTRSVANCGAPQTAIEGPRCVTTLCRTLLRLRLWRSSKCALALESVSKEDTQHHECDQQLKDLLQVCVCDITVCYNSVMTMSQYCGMTD